MLNQTRHDRAGYTLMLINRRFIALPLVQARNHSAMFQHPDEPGGLIGHKDEAQDYDAQVEDYQHTINHLCCSYH
jgi:hypothetical protein